jgi:uncharacterized small protein (DUF1192 family)
VVAKKARDVAMSTASAVASSLVQREETRSRSRMLAYDAVASKVGMSAAWVRKLVAGTVKSIDAEIKQKLDALLVKELEAEIARLTQELEMARRGARHPAVQHVVEIEAHLSRARSLLSGGAP